MASEERIAGDAAAEWRQHWGVAVAACTGVCISTLLSYSSGVFVEPLEKEFGWSRAAIMSGSAIVALLAILMAPLTGMLVDRFGPRRLGMIGVPVMCASVALLALAQNDIWVWRALWVPVAVGVIFVQPMIWTSAVTSLFAAGRGLALAVTLCGSGISSILIPPFAFFLIEHFGWRLAYVSLAGTWLMLGLPVITMFFFSARERPPADGVADSPSGAGLPAVPARQIVRSSRFIRLNLAAMCIGVVIPSIAISIVPILISNGIGRTRAPEIAAFLGVAAIVARLSIGHLLDRIPGRYLASACFCLPVAANFLLFENPGSDAMAIVAVGIYGLALGSELDILAYLASRYFPLGNFGLVFGTISGILTFTGGIGPVILSSVYDVTGAYELALWGMIPLILLSIALLLSLGRYPSASANEGQVQPGEDGLYPQAG